MKEAGLQVVTAGVVTGVGVVNTRDDDGLSLGVVELVVEGGLVETV